MQPVSAQCVEIPDCVLVWSDEFDGTEVDLSKWSFMLGDGTEVGLPPGWGNNELQYYQAENATVAGGFLTITAKEESVAGRDYTSARMRSLGKGDWTFGRVEMRARMPIGPGMWPAFWMLPSDSVYGTWAASGEIDIVAHSFGGLVSRWYIEKTKASTAPVRSLTMLGTPNRGTKFANWAVAVDRLDGILDEPNWALAETKVVQYEVDAGIPGSGWKLELGVFPTDRTNATLKFLVDGNQLYMGAVVPDSSIGGGPDFNRFDGFLMAMKDHGLPVWLDQWDIQRGQNWDRAIARGIDGCAVFLIVLSPASVASNTVLNELSVALDKQKRLIPVRLEPCELPFRIHRAQYLDFAEREYADALGDLLAPQTQLNHGCLGQCVVLLSHQSQCRRQTSVYQEILPAFL